MLICSCSSLQPEAGLKTFLISKTGTFDPTYKAEFYGGDLLQNPSTCLISSPWAVGLSAVAKRRAATRVVLEALCETLRTEPPQCCTVTIAEFTRQSIIEASGGLRDGVKESTWLRMSLCVTCCPSEAFGIKPQFIQSHGELGPCRRIERHEGCR